jgi:hypothetical protein
MIKVIFSNWLELRRLRRVSDDKSRHVLDAGPPDWFKLEWLPSWFAEIFLKSNGGNLAVSSQVH